MATAPAGRSVVARMIRWTVPGAGALGGVMVGSLRTRSGETRGCPRAGGLLVVAMAALWSGCESKERRFVDGGAATGAGAAGGAAVGGPAAAGGGGGEAGGGEAGGGGAGGGGADGGGGISVACSP